MSEGTGERRDEACHVCDSIQESRTQSHQTFWSSASPQVLEQEPNPEGLVTRLEARTTSPHCDARESARGENVDNVASMRSQSEAPDLFLQAIHAFGE